MEAPTNDTPIKNQGIKKLKESERKSKYFKIRINENDKDFLDALREEKQIKNLSKYIFNLLKNKQTSSHNGKDNSLIYIEIKELNIQISKIGNNLNQIAKMLNTLQGSYTSNDIKNSLFKIESQINIIAKKHLQNDTSNTENNSL